MSANAVLNNHLPSVQGMAYNRGSYEWKAGTIMGSFLRIENRHTRETLRMRRVHDASGQIILIIEGSLPPGSNGPPPHIHFQEREEGEVRAGTLAARIENQTLLVQ